MPKQAAPLQKRPVKVFHIRDEWIQIYHTAAAAPAAPKQQDVLKPLSTFLNKDASQTEALASLRRLRRFAIFALPTVSFLMKCKWINIESSLAKLGNSRTGEAATETSTLIQTCLVPIFLEVHFARTLPNESSFRSAVFSIISSAHEVTSKLSETDPIPTSFVQDELQRQYDAFLASIQSSAPPLDDAVISHFGAVLLTSLDRPVGRAVVEKSFNATFQALGQNLAGLVQSITRNSSSAGQMATKLHLAPKFDSCNDLLKVTVGLVTKFPAGVISKSNTSPSQPLETLLALGFQICFSSDFMPDNQFMAGILIGTLLNHIPLSDWAPPLFGGPISNVKFFDVPAEWHAAPQYLYAALAVYRGLMSTMPVETLANISRVDPISSM